MSTTTPEQSVIDELSPKAGTLVEFLRGEVESQGGEIYVKGKFISNDVGLSSKEIGALMLRLQNVVQDLDIEKWSYTSATTWRVTTADPPSQSPTAVSAD